MSQQPSRFRFRQFSLRTGAILFLVVCIGLGVVGRWIHNVRQRGEEQLRFVNRCKPLSAQRNPIYGYVTYAPDKSVDRFTALIRKWIHPEYNRKFSEIHVSSPLLEADPPIDLSQIFGADYIHVFFTTTNLEAVLKAFQIPNVKQIGITYGVRNVAEPADFSVVAQATQLESFSLTTNYASIELLAELGKLQKLSLVGISGCHPQGLSQLALAPSLETLSFSINLPGDPREPLTAEEFRSTEDSLKDAFDELANREKLISLKITGPIPLRPNALAKFCAKSPLKILMLHDTGSAPACLAEFAKLPELGILRISDELLADAHLNQLHSGKQLESIKVGPNISGDAIIKLQEKLPNCQISRR